MDLLDRLKKEHAFWPYRSDTLTTDTLDDAQLIAFTMRYLDLPDIKTLFLIYSKKKIKDSWKKLLLPEGEYLYTLNRFFAWYYFRAKNPDSYLKSLETRRINNLIHDTGL